MEYSIAISSERFSRLRALSTAGRNAICLGAAYELKVVCQAHLRKWAAVHHSTARRLGARPTGHFETGARDIAAKASSQGAAVIIPAPGITRYFTSLTISPRRAKALTIPLHSASYGRRAGEMRHLGWRLFSRKGILFGDKGDGAEALYALKKSVTIPKDETILPTKKEMASAVENGALAAMSR